MKTGIMPSRKKAKGKARKAAKEAKAKEAETKEEESQAVVAEVAANQWQDGPLKTQLNRLVINNVTLRTCVHGCPPFSAGEGEICLEFINAYIAAFASQQNRNLKEAFLVASEATEVKFADVYYTSKLDTVISMLLTSGTQNILEGDKDIARLHAMLARYFEEWIAIIVLKTQVTLNVSKIVELESADDHTLVSFYRKRIPCTCLDDKYKEVKSMKKMGCCFNPSCHQPGGRAERSKMFSCTRCDVANYCSVECQKADWKEHRVQCDEAVKMKAAFDSSQT